MPLYRYKAIDKKGKRRHGQLEADNESALEMQLSGNQLELLSQQEINNSRQLMARSRVKRRDLIIFCFHMDQCIKAGIPVVDCLMDFHESTKNQYMREAVSAMTTAIGNGLTLSQAMSAQSGVFDGIFCNLVRAGEYSGKLNEVLMKVSSNLKWQDEQASHTRRLLMYPIFMGLMVSMVLLFLMLYLVPELVAFVELMGQGLPWHTRALILVSGIVSTHWYWIVFILPATALLAMHIIRAHESLQYKSHALLLEIPLIGEIVEKMLLARFAGCMAMMYGAGITITDCLKMNEKISGNLVIEEKIHEIRQQVLNGFSISESCENGGFFPPLVIRMIRIGEASGSLEESLNNVNYFYTRDVRESVDKLQAALEPAITVILGVIIAWVVFSVLGPIYELVAKIDF